MNSRAQAQLLPARLTRSNIYMQLADGVARKKKKKNSATACLKIAISRASELDRCRRYAGGVQCERQGVWGWRAL